MKRLRNLVAVLAMMSIAGVFTGCGDDDDEDADSSDTLPAQNIVAPADEASLTSQNNIYSVNVGGQNDPLTLTFPSSGNYQMVQGGVTENDTATPTTDSVSYTLQ